MDDDAAYRTKLRQIPVLQSSYAESEMGELPDDPQSAFRQWLDEAIAAGVSEPHAMVLSTVDTEGYPDARVLILKDLDERGWHFAIKADSPKGRQLLCQKAALTFYWPACARQVRIRGDARPLSETECRADFAARPRKAQAGAIASTQSAVLASRAALVQRVQDVDAALQHGPPPPVQWLVYAVAPREVEFWQGAKDRLHQRVRFTPSNGAWKKVLLWP